MTATDGGGGGTTTSSASDTTTTTTPFNTTASGGCVDCSSPKDYDVYISCTNSACQGSRCLHHAFLHRARLGDAHTAQWPLPWMEQYAEMYCKGPGSLPESDDYKTLRFKCECGGYSCSHNGCLVMHNTDKCALTKIAKQTDDADVASAIIALKDSQIEQLQKEVAHFKGLKKADKEKKKEKKKESKNDVGSSAPKMSMSASAKNRIDVHYEKILRKAGITSKETPTVAANGDEVDTDSGYAPYQLHRMCQLAEFHRVTQTSFLAEYREVHGGQESDSDILKKLVASKAVDSVMLEDKYYFIKQGYVPDRSGRLWCKK